MQVVSEKTIEKHHVLPLYMRGQKLFIAVGDPGNSSAMDEIKFSTGLNISPVLVDPRKLARVIDDVIEPDSDVSLSDIVEEGNLGDIDQREKTEEDVSQYENMLKEVKCGLYFAKSSIPNAGTDFFI